MKAAQYLTKAFSYSHRLYKQIDFINRQVINIMYFEIDNLKAFPLSLQLSTDVSTLFFFVVSASLVDQAIVTSSSFSKLLYNLSSLVDNPQVFLYSSLSF